MNMCKIIIQIVQLHPADPHCLSGRQDLILAAGMLHPVEELLDNHPPTGFPAASSDFEK